MLVPKRQSPLHKVVAALALLALLVGAAPVAWAQAAPTPTPGPAPSATPDLLPKPDPAAVKECGERVRKGGIGLFGLGAIVGFTGLALLIDGANHPYTTKERNAGWISIGAGIVAAAPGLYLWIRGQQTINEVEAESRGGKVSTVVPAPVPGGGTMSYLKTF